MDIPSYIHVRAVNDGNAEIDGSSTLGEEWSGGLLQMKGKSSSVRGLRVHHAHQNSHTCHVSGSNHKMNVMSCSHGGAHKHKIPLFMSGSGHLIENSCFFGKGRYVVQCFKGRNMTIRHNIARWVVTTLNTPSEPNAAFAIYNCTDITIENNISLDYGYSEQTMKFGADFYSPQNCTAKDNRIKDFYVNGSDYGIVISSKETGLSLENCTFVDIVKSAISAGGSNSSISCAGSAEIGAKYIDRVKISSDLFPWQNEALITADLCRSGERRSEWCISNKTLTEYVMDIIN